MPKVINTLTHTACRLGAAPHPVGPEPEDWRREPIDRYRVLDYTCPCVPRWYELISCGGIYRIRRNDDMYAGPWRKREALEIWHLLIWAR